MRVQIDKDYLKRTVKCKEDLLKLLEPSIEVLRKVIDCAEYVDVMPDSWLTPALFTELRRTGEEYTQHLYIRFEKAGVLPSFTVKQKEELLDRASSLIRYFPELPYKVWLENAYGIEDSKDIPAKYKTQELLIKAWNGKCIMEPELITKELLEAFIDVFEALPDSIPAGLLTADIYKRLLKKDKNYNLERNDNRHAPDKDIIDDELAELMLQRKEHFNLLPIKYQTRENVIKIVINDDGEYWDRDGIVTFIKRKHWNNHKFWMEIINQAAQICCGDNAVSHVFNLAKRTNQKRGQRFSEKGLTKAEKERIVIDYPGAIRDILKTDQTKAMADAVLNSNRGNELLPYLSLKFITKNTAPLFLSNNEDISRKVTKILTGKDPKDEPPPPYSIPAGDEVWMELTEKDLARLTEQDIPFIKEI
jgi:hypothetical protein